MSHEFGTYLGGVRSIEDLRERCFIDEHTGCWHWRMAFNQGSPRVWVHLGGGERLAMRGRRAALVLSTGKQVPRGFLVWAVRHCKSDDCVNPAHCKWGPKSEWGRDLSKRGTIKNRPSKIRAGREAGRKRRALTDEQAAYVRSSGKSIKDLAAEFGVSRALIGEIRRGTRYTEVFRGASVFVWRPQNGVETGRAW